MAFTLELNVLYRVVQALVLRARPAVGERNSCWADCGEGSDSSERDHFQSRGIVRFARSPLAPRTCIQRILESKIITIFAFVNVLLLFRFEFYSSFTVGFRVDNKFDRNIRVYTSYYVRLVRVQYIRKSYTRFGCGWVACGWRRAPRASPLLSSLIPL